LKKGQKRERKRAGKKETRKKGREKNGEIQKKGVEKSGGVTLHQHQKRQTIARKIKKRENERRRFKGKLENRENMTAIFVRGAKKSRASYKKQRETLT